MLLLQAVPDAAAAWTATDWALVITAFCTSFFGGLTLLVKEFRTVQAMKETKAAIVEGREAGKAAGDVREQKLDTVVAAVNGQHTVLTDRNETLVSEVGKMAERVTHLEGLLKDALVAIAEREKSVAAGDPPPMKGA